MSAEQKAEDVRYGLGHLVNDIFMNAFTYLSRLETLL